MARLDNWQTNLTNLAHEKQNEPFKFGTFDCSLWAMLAIEQVNGLNMFKKYLGKYSTGRGALRKLVTVDGVVQPIELFEKYLGERKPIGLARKGDIVFTASPDIAGMPSDLEVFGPVIGVCFGRFSKFVGETELIDIDTFKLDGSLWVS